MTRPIKYGPWISRNPGDADPEPGMAQVRLADETREEAENKKPYSVGSYYWVIFDAKSGIHEYRRVLEPKVETLRQSRLTNIGGAMRGYTIFVDRIDGEIDWSTKRVEWDE